MTGLRGDAMRLPLADNTVDLIVTSPPYFGLRSYQDGGEHYAGQVGSEATPAEFVDALIAATREMVRVLKPSGSLWLNLGDKYVADSRGSGVDVKRGDAKHAPAGPAGYPTGGMRQKSLMGLPWRYALRCIDELGLILRAEVIWNKPNGLPESVTDRVRRSHEQWFHLVQQPRYYSAVDEIRETHAEPNGRPAYGRERPVISGGNRGAHVGTMSHAEHRDMGQSPLGKLPGSVWTVPTAPLVVPDHLGVDHFAAFPPEWPKRIIPGWSPPGVCTACGEGRRPVATSVSLDMTRPQGTGKNTAAVYALAAVSRAALGGYSREYLLRRPTSFGYVCACTPYTDHPGSGERHRNGDHPSGGNAGANVNAGTRLCDLGAAQRVGPVREYHFDQWTPAPTRPAVVLDVFGGTGTTAMVATALGRTGISVDLSADYCRLAQWRGNDPAQHAKVRGEAFRKPEPVTDGQGSLFDGAA